MICNYNDNCKLFKNSQCDEEFCIRQFKIDKFLNLALLSEKQKKDTYLYLDSDNSDYDSYNYLNEVKKNILNFIDSGNNLYIYSQTTGNGKTEWSLKLLKQYIYKIWYLKEIDCRALFVSVPRYLLSIKDAISNFNEYANHIKNNVLSAQLVVWDDIATKGMTEFETENVLSIIDARINMSKSNIFTSNINPQELNLYIGDRLTSRIIGSSQVIEFKGKDKRGLNSDLASSN